MEAPPKMDILCILGSFFPAQSGGPNNSVYWMGKALTSAGMNFTVATLKDGLSSADYKRYGIVLNRESRIEGLSVRYFGYLFNRYLSIKMYFWLIKNIPKYDIVYLNSIFFPFTWFSALLCVLYNVPFVISPRGELEDGALKFNKRKKLFLLNFFVLKLLCRAKLFLVTSDQEKKYTYKYVKDKSPIFVFPNFIEINDNPISEKKIQLKSGIIYLGRLHPKKGIENLIAGYEQLFQSGFTNHKLIIVGAGDKSYVNDLLKNVVNLKSAANIEFLGHKTGAHKKSLLLKSKVLVMPSYSENFGNVVLEALSEYTPVIASIFTPWDILEKTNCGQYIDNDPESIAQSLAVILEKNDKDFTVMAQNARSLVLNNFNIDKNIKKLIVELQKISYLR
jgi:glycosyltransferase involved in cell wall biosynthesis